ncbi:MAG TPA: hypothetical protein VMT32_19530, partial [Bryobacteraceae bacterium]|nr:hypothetical protein [Bryobacteraceae bacterium]
AGLISIYVAAREAPPARDAVERAVGSDQFVLVNAVTLPQDSEAAADEICRRLEEGGYIRKLPKPFTGGAGI